MIYALIVIITSLTLNSSCSYSETSTLELSLTPLMQAVQDEDAKKVKDLVESGVDVNAVDNQGRTALFIAAQNGQADIIKELLKAKNIEQDKPDKDGFTPLAIAVENRHVDAVNALLIACDKTEDKCEFVDIRDTRLQWTPLARAASSGNEAIIKQLLQAGANPLAVVKKGDKNIRAFELYTQDDKEIQELLKNKTQVYTDRALEFINAVKQGERDKAEKLFALGIDVKAKGTHGYTPLHHAAKRNYKNLIQPLIDMGADINAKTDLEGYTPLHNAAIADHTDIVELLIKNKADLNIKDDSDYTPLHFASFNNHKDIAKLLVNAGAHVNMRNESGASPLYYAAERGFTDLAKLFIENKADVNMLGYKDELPLHVAAKRGDSEIVKLLIDAGANVNAKNQDGNTALHLVSKNDRSDKSEEKLDIVKMLIKAGADVNAKGQYGYTAESFAVFFGNKEIADLLKDAVTKK